MATLIFDLDGTLVNTSAIFIPAIRLTMSHFPHVMQPTEQTIQKTFGFTDDEMWKTLMPESTESERALAFELRDSIIVKNMHEASVLLPDAFDVLSKLHQRGHQLTTASNCGTVYLNAVLDSQGIRHFFSSPLCLEMVGGQKKADILTRHFQHFSKENAFMIGDRSSDIEAAHEHEIQGIGCQFGFGEKEELKNADYLITSLFDLLDII